ncbi:type II toxin-antitoxin system VapC family toxin [Candidatus Curtissbacteria bacterium]|nr:type II toxin-antitoxin system VapC family toxin [Candidatus Curtissbacteria bacterium]
MNYLLDTHILLWVLFSPDKLSVKLKDIFSEPTSEKFVSAISVWEISLKYSMGKIKLEKRVPSEIPDAVLSMGFNFLDLDSYTASTFYKLPRFKNKDPFDRMLAWQAICTNYSLLTKDANFAIYKDHGLKVVW